MEGDHRACREDHADRHRGGDQVGVPRERSRQDQRVHAGVVHEPDADPDAGTANARLPAVPVRCDGKSERGGGNGDDEGSRGRDRLISDRQAGIVGQHGDKMGRPDSRTAANAGQSQKTPPARSFARCDLAVDFERDQCADDADQHRKRDQPIVVLHGQAGEQAIHAMPRKTSAARYQALTGCDCAVAERVFNGVVKQ
jgi:hypothetical protein